MPTPSLSALLNHLPLIAILRNLDPRDDSAIFDAVFERGCRIIEVPLNAPTAFRSIAKLVERYGEQCLCGAGTVTRIQQVDQLADIGARLVISPHTDPGLIEYATSRGMVVVPGVATPSEALRAVDAGARALKLFPAAALGQDYAHALATILPDDVKLIATGGIGTGNLADWLDSGCAGFGIGADIYQPGNTASQVSDKLSQICTTFQQNADNGGLRRYQI